MVIPVTNEGFSMATSVRKIRHWDEDVVTMQTADKYGLYHQLVDLPETLTGEILNGQLHAQPRPAPKHLHATSRLDRTVGRGYGVGGGNPTKINVTTPSCCRPTSANSNDSPTVTACSD